MQRLNPSMSANLSVSALCLLVAPELQALATHVAATKELEQDLYIKARLGGGSPGRWKGAKGCIGH